MNELEFVFTIYIGRTSYIFHVIVKSIFLYLLVVSKSLHY